MRQPKLAAAWAPQLQCTQASVSAGALPSSRLSVPLSDRLFNKAGVMLPKCVSS